MKGGIGNNFYVGDNIGDAVNEVSMKVQMAYSHWLAEHDARLGGRKSSTANQSGTESINLRGNQISSVIGGWCGTTDCLS